MQFMFLRMLSISHYFSGFRCQYRWKVLLSNGMIPSSTGRKEPTNYKLQTSESLIFGISRNSSANVGDAPCRRHHHAAGDSRRHQKLREAIPDVTAVSFVVSARLLRFLLGNLTRTNRTTISVGKPEPRTNRTILLGKNKKRWKKDTNLRRRQPCMSGQS